MHKVMALVAVGVFLSMGVGCAAKKPAEPARAVVERLVKLYGEDRPRFVRNLQQMEQSDDCDRVEEIKNEADGMEFRGEVPKAQDMHLKIVAMELAEAVVKCRR